MLGNVTLDPNSLSRQATRVRWSTIRNRHVIVLHYLYTHLRSGIEEAEGRCKAPHDDGVHPLYCWEPSEDQAP